MRNPTVRGSFPKYRILSRISVRRTHSSVANKIISIGGYGGDDVSAAGYFFQRLGRARPGIGSAVQGLEFSEWFIGPAVEEENVVVACSADTPEVICPCTLRSMVKFYTVEGTMTYMGRPRCGGDLFDYWAQLQAP